MTKTRHSLWKKVFCSLHNHMFYFQDNKLINLKESLRNVTLIVILSLSRSWKLLTYKIVSHFYHHISSNKFKICHNKKHCNFKFFSLLCSIYGNTMTNSWNCCFWPLSYQLISSIWNAELTGKRCYPLTALIPVDVSISTHMCHIQRAILNTVMNLQFTQKTEFLD